LAVALAVTAIPLSGSFAAGDSSHGDKANMLFGMEVSAGVNTDQTRKAFWDKMKPADQAMVMEKCKSTDRMAWSPQETDFCRMLQN
jgi:hypothetical protein